MYLHEVIQGRASLLYNTDCNLRVHASIVYIAYPRMRKKTLSLPIIRKGTVIAFLHNIIIATAFPSVGGV